MAETTKYLQYIGCDNEGRHTYKDQNDYVFKFKDCDSPREVCQKRGDMLWTTHTNSDGELDIPLSPNIKCVFVGADIEKILSSKDAAVHPYNLALQKDEEEILSPKDTAIHLYKLALQKDEEAKKVAKEANTIMQHTLINVLRGLGFADNTVVCTKTGKLGILQVTRKNSESNYSIMFYPICEDGKPAADFDFASSIWEINSYRDFEKKYNLLKDAYIAVKAVN